MNAVNKKNEMRRMALCIVLLAAIAFFAHYNTLFNGFVYDDNEQVLNNTWITDIEYLPKIFSTHTFGFMEKSYAAWSYRPMFLTAYMIEYALFGTNPVGWHLANILIHILNTILVFVIISCLLSMRGTPVRQGPALSGYIPPFFAAAVFATHPANSEPVAWVGCVPELAFTSLTLIAFHLHIKSRDAGCGAWPFALKYRIAPALLFLTAILFKETAAALPILILIYDFSFEERSGIFELRKYVRYIPYLAAGAAYLLLRVYALGHVTESEKLHGYLSGYQYFINAFPTLAYYVKSLLLPTGYFPLQLFNPVFSITEPRASIPLILTVIAASLIFLMRRRIRPTYILSVSFFAVPLAPAFLVIFVSPTPLADRYLYFPTIGLALFIALLLKDAPFRKQNFYAWGALGALVIVIFLYSIETAKRGRVWKNDLALWSASLQGSSGNYLAMRGLGAVLLNMNRTDEAVELLERASKVNSALAHPDQRLLYHTYVSLGNAYVQKGLRESAIQEYNKALELVPEDIATNFNLATLYKEKGFLDDALTHYMTSLLFAKKTYHFRDIYVGIGDCYAGKGLWAEALSNYENALNYAPGDPAIAEKVRSARLKSGKDF